MRNQTIFLMIFTMGMLWAIDGTASEFSASIEAKINSSRSDDAGDTSTEADSTKASDGGDGYLSEEKKKSDQKNVKMWLAIGPQLGLGPNILLPPNGAGSVGTTDVAPFENGGGGIGGGGGGLISGRWLQGRLGVSVGVFAERSQVRTTMDINGVGNNTFIYKYSVARFPIIVRWHKLKEKKRWSIGVGPEFVLGLKSTKGTIRSDEVLQTELRVSHDNDICAALLLGWGVKYDKWLIGLDLKFSYNITGPRDYNERVTEASGGFRVLGSHSLDARLLLGLMYEIGLGSN